MDFITTFFAGLFAKFKQSNPAVAGIIALVLFTVVHFADQGSLLGVFSLPEWLAEAVKWVGSVALALNGASTSQYVNSNKQ